MTIAHKADSATVLFGPAADQAALHGLLIMVRDLGLELLSIHRVEPGQADVVDIEQLGRDTIPRDNSLHPR